jgi:ubiquinone/menaquinone biosynthesis C-methylase UbiE
MSYVYMKSLENKAEKYDSGISFLTLGKFPKIKQYIVDNYCNEGETLLDIGMGTGTFAIKCAKKGVKVIGIDISEKMLNVAQKNIESEGLKDWINVKHIPVVDLDECFSDNYFDKITALLSFSEFYEKEQDYALKHIHRILKDGGDFILVDEFKPKKALKRIIYFIIRVPLAFITFLKSRLTTKPLKDFEERVKKFKFKIIDKQYYLLDTLVLFRLKKV